jgi:TetR/AcrR family transcriptional regulator, regulator of biofilm formation and stress response
MPQGETSKGAARRRAIVDAGIAVVSRAGAGGLTHRAVAAEAGVSLASTTYHFAGIDDLRRATFEAAADEIGSRFESVLSGAASSVGPRAAVSRYWASVLDEQRPAFVTVLELLVAATRDDALSGVADELLSRASSSLEAAGFTAPSALASELLGLALVHLVRERGSVGGFGAQALDAMARHAPVPDRR